MLNIINDPYASRSASLGNAFGTALGGGISTGLQALAEHKIEENLQRNKIKKTASGLQSLGFNQQEAQSIAEMPPDIQKMIVQQKLAAPAQQNYMQSLNAILGSGNPADTGMANAGMQGGGMPMPQQGVMGIPSGINENQATKLAQLSLQKQANESKARNAEAKRDFELKESQAKNDFETQEKLEPFLKGQAEDFNNAKKLYTKAKSMREALLKNKDSWPTVSGWLPEEIRNKLFKNPSVAKYVADANTLVAQLASSRKGQPTNFKIKLEQAAKPHLGLPYDSQLQLLNDIIKDAEGVFKVQKNLSDIKEKSGGKYPRDIRQRMIENEFEQTEESLPQGIKKTTDGRLMALNPATGQMEEVVRLEGQ